MQVKNYFSQFFLKKTKILLKSIKILQKIFRLKGIPFRYCITTIFILNEENNIMEEFDLKDGYELQTDGESVYVKTKEDKILRCPYCYNPLSDDAKEKKVCPECKKTLTGTQEHVKTLLKQNNLDIYIDLLEEKKLLALPALSKMKKKNTRELVLMKMTLKSL